MPPSKRSLEGGGRCAQIWLHLLKSYLHQGWNPLFNQGCVAGITILSITGLDTGLVSGKANANLGLSPELSPALKLTNLWRPSGVRCSFLLFKRTISLNIRKSACLFVINPWELKWGKITLTNSSSDETLNSARALFVSINIRPTPSLLRRRPRSNERSVGARAEEILNKF